VDVGRMMVSRALADADLGAMLDRDVHAEMLPDLETGQAVKFLIDFYKQHRAVPSVSLFAQQFPGYSLPYAPDPAKYYVNEVVKQYVRNQGVDLLLTKAPEITGADPFKAAATLRSHWNKLLSYGQERRTKTLGGDIQARLQRYEDIKNGVGLLGIDTPWDLRCTAGSWPDPASVRPG
jgi:hypothetical protein